MVSPRGTSFEPEIRHSLYIMVASSNIQSTEGYLFQSCEILAVVQLQGLDALNPVLQKNGR